jgi:hypothetical protein
VTPRHQLHARAGAKKHRELRSRGVSLTLTHALVAFTAPAGAGGITTPTTRMHGAAGWNDVRNGAVCDAINETSPGATGRHRRIAAGDPNRLPRDARNSDIYGGSYAYSPSTLRAIGRRSDGT